MMKLKLWQLGEFEFGRDDAKIIVPLILLLLVLLAAPVHLVWVLPIAAVYYLLLFFWKDVAAAVERFRQWQRMRCPKCKNRKIYLQGYQGYNSDEQHPHYFCENCKTTSILTGGGLLEV
ncbi:MAG: hypothetical protein WCE79_26065 [Xanthobacteraceae bacterium]